MLMYGYNLFGHLDGTSPSPSRTITLGKNISPNSAFLTWFRQDQLIQNVLMASVESIIAPTVAAADSAKSAWDALHTTYANISQTRVLNLLISLPVSLRTLAPLLNIIIILGPFRMS